MKITMKKLAFWLAVTMVLSFMVAGSIASSPEFRRSTFHFDWDDKGYKSSTSNFDQRTTADGTGVEIIDASFVSEDVSVTVNSGKEITAHLSGTKTDDTKFTLVEEKIGNTMKIYIKRVPEINLGTDSLKSANLEISIPNSFASELRVKTVSGEIEISELSLRKLSLDTISGEITSQAKSTETVLNTVSGAADLKNLSGVLKANTTSGSISCMFTSWMNSSVTANSISGSLELELPKDADFHSDLETVSGSLDNEFSSNDASKNNVKFNSVSGNLTIKKAP